MNANTTNKVEWCTYAQKYDMLLSYNPFYQELHKMVIDKIKKWQIVEGDIIADVGAGTGNYSVAVAEFFPQARILHMDSDEGMNAIAAKKSFALNNFQILDKPFEEIHFAEATLQGLVCINALYTFPNPKEALKKMYNWLSPGAIAILVDPGRIMNTLSWKFTLSWHLLQNHGIAKTMEIFRQARTISEQNTYIRKMQINGTYWTHTHEEFCSAVRTAGFDIETSFICFNGDCDLVIARKV